MAIDLNTLPDIGERTAADVLELLARPFRPEVVRSRKIAGRMVAYLPVAAVRERLDKACNTWSFRIVDRGFETLALSRWSESLKKSEHRDVRVFVVTGELEIPELGSRQALGVQALDDGAGEDLLQGAASDALKKCAKMFGAGLDGG